MSEKKGFTLAEMMVVLLVMCIVIAAFAPIMTQRNRSAGTGAGESLWKQATNNNKSIYYGPDSDQMVMIGQQSVASGENSRLILNKGTTAQNYISFKEGSAVRGGLHMNSDSIFLGTVPTSSPANSKNTSFGIGTPASLSSGAYNTAMGYYTLNKNSSGSYNTAAGSGALNAVTSGSYNTAVGYNVCSNVTTGQYKTCIGTGSVATVPNSTAEEINLGTAQGTVYAKGNFSVAGTSAFKTVNIADQLTIENLIVTGTFSNYSDKRLKNIIGESTDGLAKINRLKIFDYTFKADNAKIPHTGVIAQDLEKVFPNAVSKDEKGFLRIRPEDIFYAMVNAIKELSKEISTASRNIKTLQAENKRLKEQNKKLEKKISTLEKRISALESKLR